MSQLRSLDLPDKLEALSTLMWGERSCQHSQCWNTHGGNFLGFALWHQVGNFSNLNIKSVDRTNNMTYGCNLSLIKPTPCLAGCSDVWYLLHQGQGCQGGQGDQVGHQHQGFHHCQDDQENPGKKWLISNIQCWIFQLCELQASYCTFGHICFSFTELNNK